MDDTRIQQIATDLGVIEAAFPDIISRAERCFGDGTPSEAELSAWAEGLRTEAPHLFGTKRTAAQPATHGQIPDWLSPSEKLARARQLGLVPQGKVKPAAPLVLTPTQHAELEQLGPVARLQRYRQWQAEAQTGQR
jgi:hypothetical protein